ncbi:MAG: pilus assembly protein PilP [Zoogloeaceae bacterium]|jgi:type IV pilus assembly protein PilP|nr:pilus assembly protein PilP [Zoogloeaceae bacterium]
MNKVCIVLIALLVAACSDQENIRNWMDEQAKGMRARVEPIPQIKPYEAVPYEVANLLDPFNSSKIIPEGRSGRTGREGEPDFEARDLRNNILEKVPLESVQLIGIMNLNNQQMAAVQVESLQLIKQVKVGDWLGVDFGVITQIKEQEIVIKEVIEDSSGEWVERINALQLQVKEDGK